MGKKIWILTTLSILVPLGRAQDFTERAKIQGLTTGASDWFGVDLATDGRRTVVGAPTDSVAAPGRAHVFAGCGTIAEAQELVPGDGIANDRFGRAVAIDGDRIVVGAPQNSVGPGAAYVFRFDGAQWIEEQKLEAHDGATGDSFGASVDIQGDLIVVGAPEKNARDGKAYFFRFDGSQWNLEFEYVWSGLPDARMGYSIAIDGERVAIGAILYGLFFGQPNLGAVHMLRHQGGAWMGEGILFNPVFGSGNEYFGASIALENDRMLVTEPGYGDPLLGADVGLVHAYEWDGAAWTLQQSLLPAAAAAGDGMGWNIALDGDTAAVSAYLHDGAAVDAGSVFTFRHDGTQWVEHQTLVTSDADAGDSLYSVDLHGGLLVAGVFRDDDRGMDSGSLYVFARSFRSYGTGLAGAGALEPSLSAVGSTSPGGTFTMQFRDFVGGAPSFYFASLAPFEMPLVGGTLLVDPTPRVRLQRFMAPGNPGDPGAGDIDLFVLVPPDLSFQCTDVYVQGFALDAAAPRTISMTNGLHVFCD